MPHDSTDETTIELSPEEDRTKWLKRLLGELDKIEPLMPFKFLPDGIEYPKWVQKVEHEFSLVVMPSAKLKEPNLKLTPKRMGAVLGHICEMAVWLTEWIDHQTQNPRKNDGTLLLNNSSAAITTEEWKKGLENFDSLSNWYLALRRLAKRALCSSVDQTYEDMSDFLLGYSDAFSRKPKTLQIGNIGNPTFEIYVFMLIFWKPIDRLDSVRELHGLLVKVYGEHRIGDQKRIEKICQRIGLSFRKAGRPKKIIQTPT